MNKKLVRTLSAAAAAVLAVGLTFGLTAGDPTAGAHNLAGTSGKVWGK